MYMTNIRRGACGKCVIFVELFSLKLLMAGAFKVGSGPPQGLQTKPDSVTAKMMLKSQHVCALVEETIVQ